MWQILFRFFLDCVFPVSCVGCGRSLEKLCEACSQEIFVKPKAIDIDEFTIHTAYDYHDSPLYSKLMRKWKYAGDKTVLNYLFGSIRLPSCDEVDALIPMPLHKRRLAERGFNQAEQLAQLIGQVHNLPVENGVLLRKRYTQQQAQKDLESRRINVKDAFQIGSYQLTGKSVLLIDDVFTTGETFKSAANLLRREGINVIGFCLFRSEKK